MESRNLAARAGRWSAKHRRKAIFGWLAFVLVSVMLGGALGMKEIASEDLGDGESKRADQALADGFPDRASEEVLIQGRAGSPPTIRGSPRGSGTCGALARQENVREIESPLETGNQARSSPDGRSALVTFDPPGDDDEPETNVEPVLAAVAAVQAEHPDLRVEQFGDASAEKAVSEASRTTSTRPSRCRCRSRCHPRVAFGSLVAAGIPLLLAMSAVDRDDRPDRPGQPVFPVDESISSVILLIGLAVGVDYSLFYLRREREERAADGRGGVAGSRRGHLRPAVLVSGLTVMVAMAGMYIAGAPTFMCFAPARSSWSPSR